MKIQHDFRQNLDDSLNTPWAKNNEIKILITIYLRRRK